MNIILILLISSIEEENKVYAETKAKEQELLDNGLEYCNKAISDFLVNVESEYGSIYVTLDQDATIYNLNLTQQLTTPWQYGVTASESYTNALNTLSNISVPDFNSLLNITDDNGNSNDGERCKVKNVTKYKVVNKNGKDLYVGFNSYVEALDYKKSI